MGLGSAAIRAGQAFVEILADDSKARAVLKKFQSRMESFATSMNALGRAMLLPAVGLGIGLTATTKVFAAFEQEMAKVKARLDATDKGFDDLAKMAVHLGKTTAFTATQAAAAMIKFAEAGYDSARIREILPPALNLAAAGMLELDEAADIIITTLNAFNLKAEQIPHVVDIIAKASIESASDVRELAQAFVYASTVASTAGMPLQDLVGTLSMLHDAGIKADMAGTSMRGILLSLTSPSKEAAETMASLGVQILDVRGNMLSFDKIIAQFQKGLKGMGSGQRLGVIGKIFDTRQAAAFARLLDFGSGRIRDRIETVFDSQGTAAKVAATQLNTLAGDFKKLRGAAEAFAITVIGAIVQPMRQAIDVIRNVVLLVDAWAKKNPALVKSIVSFGLAFMVAAPALIGLSIALKLLAFAFQPLFLAMTATRVGILLTVSALKLIGRVMLASVIPLLRAGFAIASRIVTGALIFIGSSISEMVTMITTGVMFLIGNPIALLGVALVGIAAYVIYASEVFGKAVAGMQKLWRGFTAEMMSTWQIVLDALAGGKPELAFEAMTVFFKLQWQEAINFASGLWVNFSTFLLNVWDNASTSIATLMIDVFTGIRQAWSNTVGLFQAGWDVFKELGLDALHSTQNSLATVFAKIIARIQGLDEADVLESLQEEQRAKAAEYNSNPDVIARRNRITEGNKKFNKEKDRIAADGEDSKNTLEQERARRELDRIQKSDQLDAEGQAKADKLRHRLDILRFEAAEARRKAEEENSGAFVDRSGSSGPRGFPDLSGVKASVQGTFSAAAARGLGAGDNYGALIAGNTGAAAKTLKKIEGKKGPQFT